jgi:hypothetical protein
MKKHLLLVLFITFCFSELVSAQTTGTYVVCNNGNRMGSCSDTSITLADIFQYTGIQDLNDPTDNVSMYKMFRLDGPVITSDELTSITYSEYTQVYIQKMNPTVGGHEGIAVFIDYIHPPTSMFAVDTLKYTVDKGATVSYVNDFFSNLNLFSSAKDVLPLDQRILFTDESIGTETPMGTNGPWIVGKGKYKIRIMVSVCTATDYYYDSIYVIVNETPCLPVEIKNMPSVCRDEVIDITPYVYVDGTLATSTQLGEMTFTNKSDLSNPTGTPLDPTSVDMTQMINKLLLFPKLEIAYQPNVDFGVCTNYTFLPTTKVPSKISTSSTVISKDNYGKEIVYTLDGEYYSFNNTFNKNTFKKLYLDNYSNVVGGTVFNFYTDALYQSPVIGSNLAPGSYYIVATNPDCSNDSTIFDITITNSDFDIVWQANTNEGKGYYTFTAPTYDGATYSWFVWGGSIVAGQTASQATVYYSEDAASSVLVSCTITLPAPANARTTATDNSLNSAVYLGTSADGSKEAMDFTTVVTATQTAYTENACSVYPNPASEMFAISGSGVYDVKVYNTLGQLMHTNNSYMANTPISINSKGMHVIYMSQNGNTQTMKIILQ